MREKETNVAPVSKYSREAGPLDSGQARQKLTRLDELDREPECKVGNEEYAKGIAFAPHRTRENESSWNQKCDFVELGWMAPDAVTEVDSPGESGGDTVSVVG